jgi:hypothetical protein
MSNLYDIDLEQDVFFAWDNEKRRAYFVADQSHPDAKQKFHSKGDKHLASEQYKADLDASGVKYKVVLVIPGEDFREMCMMWRKAMESLGHKFPFSGLPQKEQTKAWDIVKSQLAKGD